MTRQEDGHQLKGQLAVLQHAEARQVDLQGLRDRSRLGRRTGERSWSASISTGCRLTALQRLDKGWKRYEKQLPSHQVQIDVKFIDSHHYQSCGRLHGRDRRRGRPGISLLERKTSPTTLLQPLLKRR
jgi:hypothetical protein